MNAHSRKRLRRIVVPNRSTNEFRLMKIFNVGFITLLVFQSVCGQTAPSTTKASPQSTTAPAKSYPNAKTQANQLAEATIKGDYEKAADLTYPKLIELIGGRAEYLEMLERSMKETLSDSFRVISTVAGDPTDVIEVGSDVYAILPITMKFKVAEGVLVGQAAMIGVSNDRGEHWTFVDSGKASNREQLKILFPAVADRLKLPEEKPPVLQRTP